MAFEKRLHVKTSKTLPNGTPLLARVRVKAYKDGRLEYIYRDRIYYDWEHLKEDHPEMESIVIKDRYLYSDVISHGIPAVYAPGITDTSRRVDVRLCPGKLIEGHNHVRITITVFSGNRVRIKYNGKDYDTWDEFLEDVPEADYITCKDAEFLGYIKSIGGLPVLDPYPERKVICCTFDARLIDLLDEEANRYKLSRRRLLELILSGRYDVDYYIN